MFKIIGGSAVDGNITGIDPTTIESENQRVAYAVQPDGAIQFYLVEDVQKTGGTLLLSGNYLNPVNLGQSDHALLSNRELADAHPASAVSTSGGSDVQTELQKHQTITLSGGNYNVEDPTTVVSGSTRTFYREEGAVGVQVTNTFSQFKTKAGLADTIAFDGERSVLVIFEVSGFWEVV